jgi:hypothetical protein
MDRMNKKVVVLTLSGALAAELWLGESQPHAEFLAVAPSAGFNSNIAMSNTASVQVFDAYTPVELKRPHDRLVVQTIELHTRPGPRVDG